MKSNIYRSSNIAPMSIAIGPDALNIFKQSILAMAKAYSKKPMSYHLKVQAHVAKLREEIDAASREARKPKS